MAYGESNVHVTMTQANRVDRIIKYHLNRTQIKQHYTYDDNVVQFDVVNLPISPRTMFPLSHIAPADCLVFCQQVINEIERHH